MEGYKYGDLRNAADRLGIAIRGCKKKAEVIAAIEESGRSGEIPGVIQAIQEEAAVEQARYRNEVAGFAEQLQQMEAARAAREERDLENIARIGELRKDRDNKARMVTTVIKRLHERLSTQLDPEMKKLYIAQMLSMKTFITYAKLSHLTGDSVDFPIVNIVPEGIELDEIQKITVATYKDAAIESVKDSIL
jgi:hypothetical protein